jgi:hypothetical protein
MRPGGVDDESARFLGEPFGLVAVRRMAAVREDEQFGLRRLSLNATDLIQRAVFVIFALHGENSA